VAGDRRHRAVHERGPVRPAVHRHAPRTARRARGRRAAVPDDLHPRDRRRRAPGATDPAPGGWRDPRCRRPRHRGVRPARRRGRERECRRRRRERRTGRRGAPARVRRRRAQLGDRQRRVPVGGGGQWLRGGRVVGTRRADPRARAQPRPRRSGRRGRGVRVDRVADPRERRLHGGVRLPRRLLRLEHAARPVSRRDGRPVRAARAARRPRRRRTAARPGSEPDRGGRSGRARGRRRGRAVAPTPARSGTGG
jgi:hypothetical protein